MKRLWKPIFVLVLLAVFLWSGTQIYAILSAYREAERQYARLEAHVTPPAPAARTEGPEEALPEQQPEALPPAWPQVDFAALAEINPDIVGWLTIEDTNIHYPVVQGEDNAFYLTHQFDKTQSRAGCLFLDVENAADFSDLNSVIYGHYTKDKSMFYTLRGYKTQDFYDAHPTGWLITPAAVWRLRFFSGYVSDVYGDGWNTDFSESGFSAWLKDCKAKSGFRSEVVPDDTCRVLTLSTCSYEFDNARFVLHAVLEEVGVE